MNYLAQLTPYADLLRQELTRAALYGELAWVAGIYLISYLVATKLKRSLPVLQGRSRHSALNRPGQVLGQLLWPLLAIVLLRLSLALSQLIIPQGWVLNVAMAVAALLFFSNTVTLTVTQPLMAATLRWLGMPILFLHFVGLLDDLIVILESMSVELGAITLSAYSLVRTLIFGSLLFWLGRLSNQTGKRLIRSQASLDLRTQEVFTKLFEVTLFVGLFILLLQVMGINLTTLAVFGGALGVGLGFGLQAIASNFISGIIILLDRSITLGDYV